MKRGGRIKLVLTGHDSVPLLPLFLDGARLDLALHFTVQLDLDVPDLGEVQTFAMQDFKPCLRIGDGVVAVATFEARVSWLFAVHHATKERGKGFIASL